MKYFKHIDLHWSPGDFCSLCQEATKLAASTGLKVSFPFNGLKINVTSSSGAEEMWEKYQNAIKKGLSSIYCNNWV